MKRTRLTGPDLDQVLAALEVVGEEVSLVVEAVSDWGAPVRGSHSWTVIELVRHMSLLAEGYAAASTEGPLAMAPSAAAMAQTNARTLAVAAGRTAADLPSIFRGSVPLLLDHLRASAGEAGLPWHAGLALTPAEQGGVALGEWLVHGWELAKTVGVAFRVRPQHARLVLAALCAVLPAWVDGEAAAGHTGRYEYRLRGSGQHLQWTFTDGVLSTRPAADETFRADTVVWADPSALLLYFYRRTGLFPDAARGRLVAGGRRPLRALTVRNLFRPA